MGSDALIYSVLIYGLVNGAVIMLTSLGFSLTFGLSGVANLAHGGIYLLSGCLAWILLNTLGLPFLPAAVITMVLAGLLGAGVYWLVLQRVRGLALSEMIVTFTIGIGILEFLRWAGFVTYDFNLPVIIKGSLTIAGVIVDYQRLLVIGVGVLIAVLLWFFSHHTKIGLALRGMAQDEYTALSVGIDSDWAAALSMALGHMIVAMAAIMILPLGLISINVGYDVLTMVLAVTILGGLESTAGLTLASLILGYATAATGMYLNPQWTQVVYLAAIVLVLALRPSGLLGKFKELEERV
ncbi:MAG: branched-chain amino acid ABC transporter permease [Clostridia bacterium]|nr:MAG: branched-chain amino acid ABC transporter permease [Clostridia bacterium]